MVCVHCHHAVFDWHLHGSPRQLSIWPSRLQRPSQRTVHGELPPLGVVWCCHDPIRHRVLSIGWLWSSGYSESAQRQGVPCGTPCLPLTLLTFCVTWGFIVQKKSLIALGTASLCTSILYLSVGLVATIYYGDTVKSAINLNYRVGARIFAAKLVESRLIYDAAVVFNSRIQVAPPQHRGGPRLSSISSCCFLQWTCCLCFRYWVSPSVTACEHWS